MIDLKALDNDPWPTFPTRKEDLRALADALRAMEEELRVRTFACNRMYDTLAIIATQEQEPKSRNMARQALLKGLQ